MKPKKKSKVRTDSEARIRRYEMEKKSLYYSCRTQEELERKLRELAQRLGI